MVRVFPPFRTPTPDEWGPRSEGFPAAMMKLQVATEPPPPPPPMAYNGKINGPLICRQSQMVNHYGIFYGENPLDNSFTLLLIEMSTVILISLAVRFLLKPLKQPRVVSDVIGGIIIGPSILGRSKTFRKNMFPEQAIYVVKNIGILGFMYFLFVSGVKMDLGIIRKAGKKQWYIALFGVLIPMVAVAVVAIILHKSLDKDIGKVSSIGIISSAVAVTVFPVLYPVLKDLNLLSSEVGRNALSTCIISDVIGINIIVVFEAATQGEVKKMAALWYTISVVVLFVFIVGGLQRATDWIVSKTPEGKPVDQIYVIVILLGVMVMGFMTDMFGVAIANGPLWLGLAIPDGPPLGATLVERSETIIMDILMPFSFAFVGLYTDVDMMSGSWSTLEPLFLMALSGYLSKLVVTFLVSLYLEMPLRDSVALSLIMSLRGQMEYLIFIHWMDKKIIKTPAFTLMVILTTALTAIITPLISIVYDPTRPYIINQRRTIQHTPPNTEVHIVACIHDQESVAGILNLLEISNPTVSSPFMVHAIRLIDLIGRGAPVFIDHEKQDNSKFSLQNNSCNTIHNALQFFQDSQQDLVNIHSYTAIAPRRSMYQDICELALVNKATLIILPFHKEVLNTHGGTAVVRHGVQSVNSNVISHSPCSIAILVDRSSLQSHLATRSSKRLTTHHFAVLFLGGGDAREALAYADRMARNTNVSLTVIRFLSFNSEGDNEMEKKLDDGVVTWFWVKNEANERVVYKEVVVKNGEETVAAIQAMNDMSFNLWIMGRKEGINPKLLEGLSDWSENHELGIIGDFVACMEFGGFASVLVIQQQILRERMATTTTPSRNICH